MVSSLGFDYDVIDVGLNGSPDEVSEAIEHTALVRCPSILQTERHRNVAKRSEGGVKDVASWSDSFIAIWW